MSVGPLKRLMASAAAVGAVATGPLTGNAIAEDSHPITSVAATSDMAVIGSAVEYGRAGRDNVGVLIYYGRGNEPTADQVGNFLVDKLEGAGVAQGQNIDADYFWVNAPNMNGIVVSYTMGGVSMEDYDIHSAFTPKTLSDVIQKRQDVSNTIDMAYLPR